MVKSENPHIIVDKFILSLEGIKAIGKCGKSALPILYGIAALTNPKTYIYYSTKDTKEMIAEYNEMSIINVEHMIRKLISNKVLIKINERGLYKININYCELVFKVTNYKTSELSI